MRYPNARLVVMRGALPFVYLSMNGVRERRANSCQNAGITHASKVAADGTERGQSYRAPEAARA
jgi:hypothetical protein